MTEKEKGVIQYDLQILKMLYIFLCSCSEMPNFPG